MIEQLLICIQPKCLDINPLHTPLAIAKNPAHAITHPNS